MIKKQSNFIEEHIEKVVLIIGALGALFILYKFVLGGGTEVVIDNVPLRPGQVDIYIADQAELLKMRLEREPIPKPEYIPQSIGFLGKMNYVLDSNLNVLWPMPSSVESTVNKKYRIPVIGPVNDVDVEHIRAAAYLPKVAVTPENVEAVDTYEVNDLDLVTVGGNFDLAPLIDSFHECFAGKEVPDGWRDTGLARPVFAGVQLQRQRLGDDGQWSQWEDVPHAKIDPYGDKYKIIENVNELPNGGIMIELANFGETKAQADLLQPDSYKIASAEEKWLPPALHRKFLTVRREKEAQDRRDAVVAERDTKTTDERERTVTRPAREEHTTTDRTRGTAGRMTTGGRGAGAGGGGGGGGRSPMEMERGGGATRESSRTTARPDRNEQTRDRRTDTTATETKKIIKPAVTEASIEEEMRKMLLATKRGDISSMRETINFWAYDDTVEPGASYRYRIRLGVFNPVGGTDRVREEDIASKNKVVLWSDYSEVTDIVDIPKRMYFFPVNVQESAKAAEVQVCKYAMGYWHSEQFMVKRGDTIGKAAKVEASEKDKVAGVKLPEMINYSTGAIIVDMVAVNDWVGDKTLQSRQYFDVLFSVDGVNVDRLPAKQMYWPEDLRLKYSELKALEKKTKEPFRTRSDSGTIEVQPRGMPGDRGRGPMDRNTQQEDYMRMRMGDRGPAQ